MPTFVSIKGLRRVLSIMVLFALQATCIKGQSSEINVYNVQSIAFGAFTNGHYGGTVTVSPSGVRTTTGSVVPLNFGLHAGPAIFEIEAPAGSVISFSNRSTAVLKGSNGGTMTAQLEDSDPVFPFNTTVSSPERTRLFLGGTLTVGTAAVTPAGSYSGSLDITFNYQ